MRPGGDHLHLGDDRRIQGCDAYASEPGQHDRCGYGLSEEHADDVVCCILPMAFSYGLCQCSGACTRVFAADREVVCVPFDVLRRAAAARVTGLPGVPTMFARLIQMCPLKDIDLSSVRYATNAAAAIPPRTCAGSGRVPNIAFYPMYGQTECTRAAFLDPSSWIRDQLPLGARSRTRTVHRGRCRQEARTRADGELWSAART